MGKMAKEKLGKPRFLDRETIKNKISNVKS